MKSSFDLKSEDFADHLLKDPITGEPLKSGKPDTSTLSEIRRRAARVRWDAPREKSDRVTVTIPAPLAKKLRAAAETSQKPTSHLVAQCIKTALPSILLDLLANRKD